MPESGFGRIAAHEKLTGVSYGLTVLKPGVLKPGCVSSSSSDI
jgi:hypothetical protein